MIRALIIAALIATGAFGQPVSAVQLQVSPISLLPGTSAAGVVSANSNGQVTGYCLVGGVPRAWYWSAATGTLQITSSQYGSTFAWVADDNGTLLGNGSTASNEVEAFT